MNLLSPKLLRFRADRSGSINIIAAASAAFLIGVLAVGIDYGFLTLQRRTLQNTSDLAAIVAASNIEEAEAAALQHFARNGGRIALKRDGRLITTHGEFPIDQLATLKDIDGYAEVVKGRYTPDPTIQPANRFVAGQTPYNAVTVTTRAAGDLVFARSIASKPAMSVKSVAAAHELAAFSVGSRAASLNGGLLNKVLGALLGTEISLSAMDYEALADADIELFDFTQSLATKLNMRAVTYDQLLQSEVQLADFVDALGDANGLSPAVAGILNSLGHKLGSSSIHVRLDRILNLDPYRSLTVGESDGFVAEASAFELLTSAVSLANAGKQVAVDLGTSVPGLADIKLNLAIGEPPVGTPFLAVGQEGSVVRTAQTRLMITASVNGLSALAGIKISVPLYVEIANAEAALTSITCLGGNASQATVKVAVVPGVAEVAIGKVDPDAFNHFESPPRVLKAVLVAAPLLKVSALGHAHASNLAPDVLTFSPTDIAENRIRSVSTRDMLTSLTSTLLRNLELDVQVLVLTIGSSATVQAALADTLSKATAPLDTVIYNTLLALGIRIGEADVRVTGVSCQRPVLVQ